jgi:hypothetical protein
MAGATRDLERNQNAVALFPGMVWAGLFYHTQHFLPKRFEVQVEFRRLRQDLVFFFRDVVPHALREYGEFGVAVVVAAVSSLLSPQLTERR